MKDEQAYLAEVRARVAVATRGPWGMTPMGLSGAEPTVLNIWDAKDDSSGVGVVELSRRYGVTHSTMWCAVNRRTWRHVP